MDTNALRRAAENRKLATYAEAEEQYASDLAAIDRVSQLPVMRATRTRRPIVNGLWGRVREIVATLPANREFTMNEISASLDDVRRNSLSMALSCLSNRGELIVVRMDRSAANGPRMNVYRRATPADAEQPQSSTNGEHAPEPELVTA